MSSRKVSVGVLVYRRTPALEVLLAHPGGPFFRLKDEGAWTIPKGGVEDGELEVDAATREFEEEVGPLPVGEKHYLGEIVQLGGKRVKAWRVEAHGFYELPAPLESMQITLEYPPHSGRTLRFPEIDRAQFFSISEASNKIMPAQLPFLSRLNEQLAIT